METAEGTLYNVTQCTVAMIIAGQSQLRLDHEEYKVWPANPEAGEGERVMGHYVLDSKPWYFGRAWQKSLV